jgi:hypothetical protein
MFSTNVTRNTLPFPHCLTFLLNKNTKNFRQKKHFSQLLNVHSVTDIRQKDIHTVEPLKPYLSPFQVGIATAKLKTHKSKGSDQFKIELNQTGGETLLSQIHKLVNYIWNK